MVVAHGVICECAEGPKPLGAELGEGPGGGADARPQVACKNFAINCSGFRAYYLKNFFNVGFSLRSVFPLYLWIFNFCLVPLLEKQTSIC